MTIEQKYLNEYNYLKSRAYMDCSTMGLQPQRTLTFARNYLDDFAYSFAKPKQNGEEVRNICKQRIAALIGANKEDVFLTANTTMGNNLLTTGYPFEKGDEVIIGNGDFPAVWIPWAKKQENGIKLRIVENENGAFPIEDFIAQITPKTKVIALSWAQSSSGYVANVAALGKLCREKGIIFAVDAVQGLGRLPINVEHCCIDVLSSASYKGLLGVMGAGFCYCRKEIMNKITPPICSGNIKWDAFDVEPNFKQLPIPQYASGAIRMESGTSNTYGYAVMSQSIGLLLEIGIDAIAAHVRQLEKFYRQNLKEQLPQIEFLGTNNEETWSGSVSFKLSPELIEPLKNALDEAEISVAVRDICRVSLHYYNTETDIQRLIKVLCKVLK